MTAGATMGAAALPVRERILLAAGEMFYRDGVRAVGIDAIIEQSGVAKMSLYRSFPSKEALVVAWLERLDAAYWQRWTAAEASAATPRAKLDAVLDMVAERTADPGWRGCAFLNTCAEFPGDGPANAVVRGNKHKVRARLRTLAEAAGAAEPDALADQLQLLIDGACVLGQALGPDGPAGMISRAGRTLIAAALEPDPIKPGRFDR